MQVATVFFQRNNNTAAYTGVNRTRALFKITPGMGKNLSCIPGATKCASLSPIHEITIGISAT
ncbi:MAG: hypothetical protein ACYDDV_12235 [Methanoregula sp.]